MKSPLFLKINAGKFWSYRIKHYLCSVQITGWAEICRPKGGVFYATTLRNFTIAASRRQVETPRRHYQLVSLNSA